MKVEGMAVWYDLTYHMKWLSCSTIGTKKNRNNFRKYMNLDEKVAWVPELFSHIQFLH
jgi:hypothetical protein